MKPRTWVVWMAGVAVAASVCGCPGVDRRSEEVAALREVLSEAGPARAPAPQPVPASQPVGGATTRPQLTAAVVTLRQCLEWTLEHNLRLSVERLTPEVRDAQVVEAMSAFDALFATGYTFRDDDVPTASLLTGDTGLTSQVHAAEARLGKRLLTGAQASVGTDLAYSTTNNPFAILDPRNDANFTVGVTQPLLRDFGVGVNTAAIRIARNNKAGSVHLFRKSVEDTLETVEEAYWSLYLSIEALNVRRRQLQRALDLLDRAKKFVEAGKSAPVERTAAEAEVASVRSDIVNAENVVRRVEDTLKRLINRPDLPLGGPTRIVPADGPGDFPVELDLQKAVAEALSKRPDLKALELDQDNAAIREKVARNQRLPRLDLTLQYQLHGLDRYAGRSLAELGQFEYDQVLAGIQAQIPLGNRAARSRCQQAILLREQVRRHVDDLRQQIVFDVTRGIDELRTDHERITSVREATRLAQERLKDEEALYRHERSTRTDLLQAQTNVAERELDEIIAVISFNVHLATFHRLTGTYLEHNRIEIAPVSGN